MNKLFALKSVVPRAYRAFRKSVTLKKIVNALLSRTSLYLSNFTGKIFIWGMPQSVMIEPTDNCNYKCWMCPRQENSDVHKTGIPVSKQ